MSAAQSNSETQFVPAWVPVTDGNLPPPADWLTSRSEKLLLATDEMDGGITFGYCVHDEDDGPSWQTACASGFTLSRVTHYAPRPALP